MRKFGKPFFITSVLLCVTPSLFAGDLIFDADFDSQADWTPEFRLQSYSSEGSGKGSHKNLPGKFDYYRTSERWHPSSDNNSRKNYPSKEPVAQISSKVSRNEGGKSFIVYDESWGSNGQWGADAVFTKDLGEEYPELWVETWVKFDPDWVWADQIGETRGQTAMKLLRCRRHSGISTDNRFSFFGQNALSGSPVALIQMKSWTTSKGNLVRPAVAIRGYTHPDAYKTENDYYDFGGNYKTKLESSVRNADGKSLSWKEAFLDDKWHKIALYLKMDSSPGAKDGIVEVWIDGKKTDSANDVPWRQVGDPETLGWNECSIGGNAHNIPYSQDEQYEQWYAIDDFKIYDGRPSQ